MGDASFGILYSTTTPLSVVDGTLVMAQDIDANNKYTVTVTRLTPETTYYYASFIKNGLIYRLGSVKSFQTSVIPVDHVVLNKTEYTFNNIGETFTLSASVYPVNAADKSVIWSSSNDAVAAVDQSGLVTCMANGNATITVTTKDQNQTASCNIQFMPLPEGAVDLGLSVYWAKCNLGASKPEEYGDYYAWGETETKTNYDWLTYKWCNGDSNIITKYCPTDKIDDWDGEGLPDGKTTLDAEDDAAHVKLGGSWRMPTAEEWSELIDNCTWTWTTENGVKGRKVIGPKGNSIFLPAARGRLGTYLYPDIFAEFFDHMDYLLDMPLGLYWSSSLYNPDTAWGVSFTSDYYAAYELEPDGCPRGLGHVERLIGSSIRPVYVEEINVSDMMLDKTSAELN